jgi:hypothetical protein
LIDGKTTGDPDIITPQALILRHESKVNVERYDGLRTRIAGGRHAVDFPSEVSRVFHREVSHL